MTLPQTDYCRSRQIQPPWSSITELPVDIISSFGREGGGNTSRHDQANLSPLMATWSRTHHRLSNSSLERHLPPQPHVFSVELDICAAMADSPAVLDAKAPKRSVSMFDPDAVSDRPRSNPRRLQSPGRRMRDHLLLRPRVRRL